MSSVPIPSDLINQIQSTLRSKSQIHSSSDLSLPSVNDLIAAFDSDDDPSHLRCANCLRSGGFIRGHHSTLCFFCGRDRGKDGIAYSMSFKSTLACKNLLQYLQLDGSETVNSGTKSNDSDEVREIQQSHMLLSSLLDLELKWPSEKETVNENPVRGIPVKDEVSVPAVNLAGAEVSVPAVNLSGADFDNFFTDSINRTIGASTAPILINEKSLPLKQSVNKENSEASRNDETSLFNAVQTSNVAGSSIGITSNEDGFDSFADWDASFESANSGTGHSESKLDNQNTMFSKSVDLFEESTTSFEVSESSIIEPVNSRGNTNNSGKNDGNTDEWGIFSDNMVQNDPMAISASDLKQTGLTNENDSWGEGEAWATALNTEGKTDDTGDNLAEGEIWATPLNSEGQHEDIRDKNQFTDDWGDFSFVSGTNMVRNDVGTIPVDHLQSTSKTNDSGILGHSELWDSMSNTNDGDKGNNTGVISPADNWGSFPSITSSTIMVQNDVVTDTTDNLQSTSKTNDSDFWGNNELWASMSNTEGKSDDNGDRSDNTGALSLTDDWGKFSSSDKAIENKLLNTRDDTRNTIKSTENVSWDQDEIGATISNTKTERGNNVETDNHEERTDDWGEFFYSDVMLQNDSKSGSETTNGLGKGQETQRSHVAAQQSHVAIQQSHVALPSLLDVEQKWPSEKEVVNGNLEKDEPSVPAVNLSDINMFFTDSMNMTTGSSTTTPVAFSEKSLPLKQSVTTENQEASRKDDNFLFSAFETSNMAVSSIEGSRDGFDSFADWDASFLSANSGTSHSESKPGDQNVMFSKSVDLIEGSTAGLAISETSVKEPVNYSQGKINNVGNIELNTDEWGIFSNNVAQKNVLVDSNSSNLKSTGLKDEDDSWGEGEEMWATASNNTEVKRDDVDDISGDGEKWVTASNNTEVKRDGIDDSWGDSEIWATASNSKSQHDDKSDKNQPADDWGDFSFVTGSNNIVQNDVAINNTTDHLKSTSKTNDDKGDKNQPADDWGEGEEMWATASNNTEVKRDDVDDISGDGGKWVTASNNTEVKRDGIDDSWGDSEIWATASNSKSQHDDKGDKNQPADDWGDFSFVTGSNNIVQNDVAINNTTDQLKSTSKTNDDKGDKNQPADDWGDFSFVTGSNNIVQNDVAINNATDHLKSTSKTNDIEIWGDGELWSSMFTTKTKSKSNDNGDMGNNNIGVISSANNLGNFSSDAGSSNMARNEVVTNATDHLQSLSKTNDSIIWGHDELWASMSSNTKGKSDDNDDKSNSNIVVTSSAEDDWGNFSSSDKMIENSLLSTGDDTRSTNKINENFSWGQDEIWATISKSERNNNNKIDNHGEPEDDDWGSYESAT